jgi:uncharacterized protein DUF4012
MTDESVQPRHGRRRSRRRVVLLLAAPLAVWLLAALVLLALAALDLRTGVHDLNQARGRATVGDVVAGRPLAALRHGARTLDRAATRIDHPLVAPLRALPVLGRQLHSSAALSAGASNGAAAAFRAVTRARPLLRGGGGEERVERARQLGDLAAEAAKELKAIDLGPRRYLLPPLAHARNKLSTQLTGAQRGLERAAAGARSTAQLLAGPRRYLLFAANNAEMRAGSGMFLSVGELQTGGGSVRLGPVTSVTDIHVPPGVPLTGDLADRWGWLHPNEEWRNLMASPRFDASARLAAQMWVATGHPPVDGVLVLDPAALQSLLQATGPVTIDGRRINADNVLPELLHDQYLRYPEEQTAARREELGRIAQAVFANVDAGRWSASTLASSVADAVRGRHLLVWSDRPDEGAGWQAAGADGTLQPDSMLVSVLNRGGNKLDWFLHVSADLVLRRRAGGTDGVLTVRLRNTVPAGEPREVAGPYPGSGLPANAYVGIVTVNLPGVAASARIDGVPDLAVAGADGPTRVIGVSVQVAQGEDRTVVVRFRVAGAPAISVEPSARISPVRWTYNHIEWRDGARHGIF